LAELVYEQDLHVHHISYAHLGAERPEDLEVLCRRCHELETFGRSELRAVKEAKCSLCGDSHWDYRRDFCGTCHSILGFGHLARIATLQNPDPSADESMATFILSSITAQLTLAERLGLAHALLENIRTLEENRNKMPAITDEEIPF
jgi:hypothetical protein